MCRSKGSDKERNGWKDRRSLYYLLCTLSPLEGEYELENQQRDSCIRHLKREVGIGV